MKVSPMAAPAPQQVSTSNASAARERAMAALMGTPAPVDQNAISPENAVHAGIEEKPQEDPEIDTAAQGEGQVAEIAEEPVKEDPAVSRQFAQLARQEKALRAQQAAFKAERDAFKAEQERLAGKPQVDTSKMIDRQRLQTDTLGVLAEMGISYDSLTEQLLNQQSIDPRIQSHIEKLEAKLAEIEAKEQERDQKMTAQQQQQYDAAIKQIESDTKKLVYTSQEFETIKETGSIKLVVDLIKTHFDETGEVLTVEEAAKEVEDTLVEEYSKLARLEKIQKRLAPAPEPKPTLQAQSQTPTQKQPQQMKTLTNQVSSGRKPTAKERALAAFRGDKI